MQSHAHHECIATLLPCLNSDQPKELVRCGSDFEMLQREAFEQAARRWPTVPLSFEAFREHLVRLGYECRLPSEIASIYLCAACALALPAACKAVERAYFHSLRCTIRQFFNDADAIEDALQEVRYRLFVGRHARIASYRGSGPLGSWLRTIALNVARDHVRDRKVQLQRRRRLQHALVGLGMDDNLHSISPEVSMTRTELIHSCERALHWSMHSIENDERQVLHHYFVDGMTVDQLGRIYSVDRSTAARRVNRAVGKLRSKFLRVFSA